MKKDYAFIAGMLLAACWVMSISANSTVSLRSLAVDKASGSVRLADPASRPMLLERTSMLEVQGNSEGVITEAPGTAAMYQRAGIGYQWESPFEVEYVAGKFVTSADGHVYIYNPLSFLITGTYMEGILEDDETIVVRFPQAIYQETWEDEEYNYFVNKMHFIFDDVENQTGWYFVDESDNTLTYKLENGEWKLQGTDDALNVLGLTDETGEWLGYADFRTVFSPYEEMSVLPPDNLEIEKWAFIFNKDDGRIVDFGIDGSDVYMRGFTEYFPEAWVKGRIEGDKIEFPNRQYLGIDPYVYHYNYMVGGPYEEVFDEEFGVYGTKVTFGECVAFSYDREGRTLSSSEAMLVNTNPEYQSYIDGFFSPEIKWQPMELENPSPAAPQISYFYPYEWQLGYASLGFTLPLVTSEGYLLDSSDLYYRLYLDGDVFEFAQDVYTGLAEDTELIPFGYKDEESWALSSNGIQQYVQLFAEGYDEVGIQSVYFQNDVMYGSGITRVLTTGVDRTYDIPETASCEYFDLNGRRVNSPSGGIFVKKQTMADGTARTSKVILK